MGLSDVMNSGDPWTAIAELQRQLRNLTSGRRLEDASIGARGIRLLDGGELTVFGGAIRMTDVTGSVGLAYFGPSGVGDARLWQFSFPSGEVAFGLLNSSGVGFWGGLDHGGNIVFSNDAGSGAGLARPYVNYLIAPAWGTEDGAPTGAPGWQGTTSTSYHLMYEGTNSLWHPKVSYLIGAVTTDGGTAQWRILFNGDEVATGASVQGGTFTIPGWGTSVLPGHEGDFTVELRCSGGATRAACVVRKLYGRQS